MQRPIPENIALNEITITEELYQRPPRPANVQAENQALRTLIHQMAQDYENLMQTLVNVALDLCQAGTTGVSLLETLPDGEEIFRWNALAGTLAPYVGGSSPRHFSPCGFCLEQGSPVLFSHPERYFTNLQATHTPIVEGLVLPLIADNHALGTIWMMSHDEQRHFDSEDVRMMTSLADLTATALLLQQRQTRELLAANATLETEVGERKQAEERSRALIQNLPGGAVFVVDRDLRYLLAEGEALAAAGFRSQDFIGRTIFEALPPHLAASYEPMYRQALAGEPFEDEHNAHDRTYLSRGTPLRAENGETYAVLVVSYEISDRKQAEQALRESEARFRTLANTAPALIWYNDAQGENQFINQYFLDFTGKSAEQIRGEGWHTLVHPEDAESYIADYLAAVREQRTWHNRNRLRRHDGVWRWHDNYAQPLFNADGVYLGHVGVTIDNTDAIEAEINLRESETKYRSLFNSMDEAFAVIEVLTGENGEWNDFLFLEVNPAFVKQTGMEYPVGRKATELLGTPNPQWAKVYGRVAETGEPIRFEEGEATLGRVFDLYVFRLGGEGSRRVAVLFADISDRKRAEETLRENEARQGFLLKLSDILQQFVQPNDIKTAAMCLLGEHLGVSRAQYHECDSSGEYYSADGVGYANGLPLLDLKYRIDAFSTFVNEDFAAGRPYRINDLTVDPRVSAEEREAYRTYQIGAGAGVPLIRGGKLVAILAVHDVRPHPWTDLEMDLIRETAERIWTPLERARAEEALRESEAKYRSLFTSIDEGFTLLEMIPDESGHPADFRIVETNPAWEQQTGLTDVVGRTLLEIASNFEQQLLDFYSDVVISGRGRRTEFYTAAVDRWYTVYASRIGGEGSCQVVAVFNDISDRKRTEEQQAFLLKFSDALRAEPDADSVANRAVRMLAEHLHLDRCWLAEVFEQQDIATIGWEYHRPDLPPTAGVYRLSDYPEIMRQIATQPMVIHNVASDPDFADSEKALLAQLQIQALLVVSLRKGQHQVIWALVCTVTTARHWNESERVLLEQVSERTWAAIERARAEAALRESELLRIREQAAREQERQRAEQLAELDRAKTLFFSNVSHEFRTPLTLSLAPLQDALSDRTHPLDPVQRERLELVHRNSLRLLKLVNTLLDFSRIEAGRMEAVYEPTDLATYTAELASVFRSAIERAGLRLIVDCPPLPAPIYVDREMWEKIVLNLLSNALKFTFSGEITVSLHPNDRNPVMLQIRDTGSGIAPEHLPHLFERFYQVQGEMARTHEGSGIGLALVYELVRLQGGAIAVSSTVGEGTCFTITLPNGCEHLPPERIQATRTLTSTALGAVPYVAEAERWLSQESGRENEYPSPDLFKVLVVDDNADMCQYLTHILSGYVQVEAVADGTAALAAIQMQSPDLILSDVMMPRLDGFGLLQTLRSDPRTRNIPVILLSARAGVEAIAEGLKAGADDYLIKPFSAQELISRVMAHLQMAQLRGEALQAARSTIRSRDEFISVVSHELNTPLVAILGWTRILRNSPPSPVVLTKALDTIERNATLQAKLVQDLLDISRIAAGKLRLNPQPIELKPAIETAIATVTQTAAAKDIHLTWQEHVTEPVIVMGDSDRLSQVFINLLTNAIKFTPELGSVTVQLSLTAEDGSAGASFAEIRVIDTGIGITADFLPHMFDRFRQAEGINSVKGLGLGLAIARHIVQLHRGTIQAESAGEGQGSTLIVRLPLLPPETQVT
ncbi:PAS domain S-box protein [Desertifilum sp. FACHB-1129]|uniref:histidine kinase n=1 Tax=Desertifilum tharense IPPAS B-1220 TaxID=1781255 RepID=A0A1E5QGG7_9CYAN|nr:MULTISPECIES: ATP-binding protein [Desertifilum]MDA0209292.1 ATP-binding protein [Cyanobacteria bacterium FC1]MBD2315081.1 PAS domain S-box protein [Desertifilum sp. FACHB-1129]MBD2325163.1 PAS domain S-box protein [Desertifilum sp. FACHB-866]MBD2332695.1 PAS domain S-box protein [Desertifilum sp. FACHB-868]OEJ73691.1 histidine kinase [Desertifilum tharense IPPAS B-1220]